MDNFQQLDNLRPFQRNPVSAYAQDAVEAVKLDQRQGVLAWRIAEFLLSQLRPLTNRPTARLEAVQPHEREFYLQLAFACVALTESIEGSAPPTPNEIRRYEGRKALALARARARHDAARAGHELDVFRPDEPGYDAAVCRRCGAGVRIHIDTAGVSAAELLAAPCAGSGMPAPPIDPRD